LDQYAEEIDEMESGQDEAYERYLLEKFPPPQEVSYLEKPTTILDVKKRVIAWYVPNSLTKEIQVRIIQCWVAGLTPDDWHVIN